jgi:hypothetical protein
MVSVYTRVPAFIRWQCVPPFRCIFIYFWVLISGSVRRQRFHSFKGYYRASVWRPIAALKFLSAFVLFDFYSTPNHTHKNKTACFIAISRIE